MKTRRVKTVLGAVLSLGLSCGSVCLIAAPPTLSGHISRAQAPKTMLACAQDIAAMGQTHGLGNFLNGLGVIRIGVTHAEGFGHQVSGIQVVRRLRDLGFLQPIQLVCDRHTQGKIDVLLGPTDRARLGVEVLSREEFDAHPETYSKVKLAILGAEDELHDFKLLPGKPSRPKDYRADYLLRLQPANWVEGKMMLESHTGRIESLEDLKSLSHIPAAADAGSVADETLRTFLLKPATERAVFYNAHTTRLTSLYRYSQAILMAMDAAPGLFDSGVTLFVLSEFSPFNRQNFQSALSKAPWGERVQISSIEEHTLTASANRIRIVFAPNLPPAAFQFVMTQSTIPSAIAGRFSRNLAKRMGVPFLETDFDDLRKELPFSQATEDLFMSALMDFSEPPSEVETRSPKNIAEFILQARSNQGENLRAVYRAGGKSAFDVSEDQVTQGLLRTRAFIQSEPL